MVEEITLKNMVQNSTILLNKDDSDFILESVDWGAVESNRVSYKFTNQAGVQVTNTTLETRNVSIIGWVCTDYNNLGFLENLKETLNKFVNPMEEMKLFYKNYALNFFPETSIKWSTEEKQNNEVMAQFKIDGFCADPLFRSKSDNVVKAGLVEGKFNFPLIIPSSKGVIFGIRKQYIILAVDNTGDVTTGFRIEFIASKGTVTNPSLTNTKTLEKVKINKVLQRGEKVIIDSNDGFKSVYGIPDVNKPKENYYKYRDLNSRWLKIKTGDNLFKYDADENVANLEVRIYFNPKFLEVQK